LKADSFSVQDPTEEEEVNNDPELKAEEEEAGKNDHPVFAAVKECGGDPEKIRNFFEIENVNLDIEDSSGMTPLMHACWKNFPRVVKFLIKQGADVNGGEHEHRYTTLHFAALANAVEVCRILLGQDVKTDRINSVNRTAAQMAGFVGNHECVCVINNFVPKEDVFFYTRKQPLETEAKLPLNLAKPIYDLVSEMNMHPVRIALRLKSDWPMLLENVGKVCQILELMSDKEFKSRDVNDTLTLKYHLLHYYLKDIKKQMEKDSETGEKKTPLIDRWIKSMLIGREDLRDGFPVFQENFVRQGVKEFPHQECQLFKALVANFHHCQKYGDGDSLTAVQFVNQAFNGQRGFRDPECSTCGVEKAEKKCSKCKAVQYCDQACQKIHWFTHKKVCESLKAKYQPTPT